VIFDSHGITDYSNGEDYVSRANSSYLCLKTSTGITSTDMKAVSGTYGTYYHAFNGGNSTYCVNGTAISNHMTKAAPGTIRGDYSVSNQQNIVHASDSVENAAIEVARFFKPEEIFDYQSGAFAYVYGEGECK
jgi:hypothetical protein